MLLNMRIVFRFYFDACRNYRWSFNLEFIVPTSRTMRRFVWIFASAARTYYHNAFSIPEIHKLHGHGKFMGAHGGDDGLQFVADGAR